MMYEYDHIYSDEDDIYEDDWNGSDMDDDDPQQLLQHGLIDRDEDEWTKNKRKKNASSVYFLGT